MTIRTLETLDAAAGELVRRRIALTQARAAMEAEMAAVEKRHEATIQALIDDCAARESAIADFCEQHPAEAFGDKRKSRETPLCTFGFRSATRLETASRKLKWADVVERCQRFNAAEFLTYKPPVVNKEAFHASREELAPDRLAQLGVRFVTEDQFYLEPKPETAAMA